MCDYIYLDGSSATVDSNFLLNWYFDERYLRNKKENQKVFVSVQQITFNVEAITVEDELNIILQTELITNINLINCYNTKGKYNILSLCDSSVIIANDGTDNIHTIRTTTSNNNYYMLYEINTPSLIQLGVLVINNSLEFTNNNKEQFKCLLKFEYQDK